MVTLQCPRCQRGVEVASELLDHAIACPHCSAVLSLGLGPEPDTATPIGQVTVVSPLSGVFPFLAPPRLPDEMGWIHHYRVLRLLGQGGMGVVFLAEDTQLERQVALKVMSVEAARDPSARKRFLREARTTAAIKCDHIVTIHQVGEVNDIPYLAMEYLQGESLATCLLRGARPSPARVLEVGLQVARGLASAHRAGLVHRDVKPGNIWFEEPTGRVKILDFGLARLTQDVGNVTQVGMVVGTPAYMSPEQAAGGAVDTRSDLFSLGALLYEFATGKLPFSGPTPFAILTAIATRDPRPPHLLNPLLPTELSVLIMQSLAKNPDERIASAAELVEELETLQETHPELQPGRRSGPTPKRPLPAPPPAPSPKRRRLWLGVALALGLIGLAIGGWFAFSPREDDGGARATAGKSVQGVTENRIVFGMSGPFSGATAELGRAIQTGIMTHFRHVNDHGGIAGRKLDLITLDDGYEPDRALVNVRELDREHHVFGYIGNVGAPTAARVLPHVLSRRMLYFGAYSGAMELRKSPPDRYVFNYRASLEEETGAAVRHLIETRKLRPEQIAVFAQQDTYGDAGFRGVVRQMRQYTHAQEKILCVRYTRNTLDVGAAVKAVLARDEIRAVVMVPTYRPAARFIREVKAARKEMLFTSTSFVGAAALLEELRQYDPADAEGVVVTQVVPPLDSHASIVLKYQTHQRRYYPSERQDPISLEGYITAAVLVDGLRRAGRELTTESLVDALEEIRDLDLGLGVPLRFGPSEHQATHRVWAIVVKGGKLLPLDLD